MTQVFLVLVYSLFNVATGLFVAAFFGRGPLRDSRHVLFLSDPHVAPPTAVARCLHRLARSKPVAATPESDDHGLS